MAPIFPLCTPRTPFPSHGCLSPSSHPNLHIFMDPAQGSTLCEVQDRGKSSLGPLVHQFQPVPSRRYWLPIAQLLGWGGDPPQLPLCCPMTRACLRHFFLRHNKQQHYGYYEFISCIIILCMNAPPEGNSHLVTAFKMPFASRTSFYLIFTAPLRSGCCSSHCIGEGRAARGPANAARLDSAPLHTAGPSLIPV